MPIPKPDRFSLEMIPPRFRFVVLLDMTNVGRNFSATGWPSFKVIRPADLPHPTAPEQADDPVPLGNDRPRGEASQIQGVGRCEAADR